jgi:hypothetical protein
MVKPKYSLLAGGAISALISILHVILAFRPTLYRHISASQESSLAQMAEQGSTSTTIASVALALIIAIWATYAFSGAGLIKPLLLLRAALIAISVIYILRALFIPTELNMALNKGYPFRFLVFSTISLVAGLLYLIGIFKQRAL